MSPTDHHSPKILAPIELLILLLAVPVRIDPGRRELEEDIAAARRRARRR